MKKNIVEISFVNKNFSAHVPALIGCVSTGASPEEIKANIEEAIQFHLEGMKEDSDTIPASFKGKYELVFKFDTQSLLKYYKNVITGSALERYSGSGLRLLWRSRRYGQRKLQDSVQGAGQS